jgi:hypothetical protein
MTAEINKAAPVGLVKDHEYAREATAQADWLNWIFAVTTFALTLACLQFKSPQRAALLCLVIFVPMYWHAFHNIPASLRALRDLERETKDPRVAAEIKYLMSKFHGWRAIPRNLALLLAPVVYSIVLLYGDQPWVLWFQQ